MRSIKDYLNRYKDSTFIIVGKGPTRFQYANLASRLEPIIFINDAVQFERYASKSVETFFFAHDLRQRVHLNEELKSTVVIAEDDAKDSGAKRPMLSLANAVSNGLSDDATMHAMTALRDQIVTYRWGGWYKFDELKIQTREEIVKTEKLFLNSGTIHSAIHFAWLCGAKKIIFIGCDGFEKAYDRRVELKADCEQINVFARIRQAQDQECDALDLKTEYVNEPRIEKIIPKIAHFVWFGAHTAWANNLTKTFNALHPDWEVMLHNERSNWLELMPDSLRTAAIDAEQYCTRSDLICYAALKRYGGVYLDCDVLALRSFDNLRRYDCFAAIQHDGRVNCAVVGSTKDSDGINRILDECVKTYTIRKDTHRTSFGPKMLTRMVGGTLNSSLSPCEDDHCAFSVLPQHYFYFCVGQPEAHKFLKANKRDRTRIFHENEKRITDVTAPYAMHLWGFDGSSLRKAFGRADALAYRLRHHFRKQEKIVGTEVGVFGGRLSEAVLRNCSNLHLFMVDRWSAFPQAEQDSITNRAMATKSDDDMLKEKAFATSRTEFAADRREILHRTSERAAYYFATESLDFVFIDADHRYQSVLNDLRLWYPKVRRGGLIAGHDIDNPLGDLEGDAAWGVRQAVSDFLKEIKSEIQFECGAEHTYFFEKP